VQRLSSPIRKMIIVRNGSFGLFWTGQLLSSAGSWLLLVAVPVQVFRLTASARDTGLAFAAEVVPLLIVSPVAGVLADRWPRRRIMITADLFQAGSVSLLLLVSTRSQLWLILVAIFAENCGSAFFGPACSGVVPALVGRGRDLDVANAWSAFSRGIVRLAGAPLGGALYVLAGFRVPVALDAASYLASALLISLMRVPRATATPAGGNPRSPGALRILAAEQRAGLAALRADRVLSVLLCASTLFLLGNGALTALLVPYVVGALGVKAASIGGLFSALGVGYLLSTYVGRRACASPRLRCTVTGLLVTVVLAFTGLFNWHVLALAFGFIGLAGLGGGAFLMVEQTLLQRRAPDHLIGRISSAYSTVVMAATLLGALLASLLVAWLGRTAALNLAIVVIAAGAAVAARLPARVAPANAAERSPAPAQ
jgi:predicted MFS family arabinose efflux permease